MQISNFVQIVEAMRRRLNSSDPFPNHVKGDIAKPSHDLPILFCRIFKSAMSFDISTTDPWKYKEVVV